MTTAAKTTFGNKLFMAAAPTAATTAIAELLTFDPPKKTREKMDVTTHDSPEGAGEIIVEGTYDPGELTGQVHYIAGSAGDTAMLTALTSGALQNIKLRSKSAAGNEDMSVQGYVTSYGPDGMAVKGKQTAAFTIALTGAATYAVAS
ncbi:MAG TPA: phage tail tube protein [Sphingomonas sp.]|jgi:hypothetical protein